jgi:hypothetical protein
MTKVRFHYRYFGGRMGRERIINSQETVSIERKRKKERERHKRK